ncbi:MAG: citramalate synthase [Chloroflexi bacterium RBG_16_68_14]|nr:MAG: citramalate synthase [Chloroflexi bacterium RBG_16_68_14]
MQVQLYDTTLRDGAQMEGISLSVEDKLKIARKLDELGVHFIEGGWPGSNPKDAEFFARAQSLQFQHAQLAAFGSTRRAGGSAETDANLRALLDSGTPVITIVGKANDVHVRDVLETTPEENLAMIADSVRFLKSHGRVVFFDAEHYFDGYFSDRDYALQCLKAAAAAGADCIALCDTNGGTILSRLVEAVRAAREAVSVPLGIHAHNDTNLAVANTLAAVEEGVVQVQGCVNGYGERCGNADLLSVIANLKLKMGLDVVTEEQLARLTEISHYVSEIVNMVPNPFQPYVGASAFAHKAGLHADGVVKKESSYQHVPPEVVGNHTELLISELGGSRGLLEQIREAGIEVELSRNDARHLLEVVKEQERRGYQYESAEASFELLVRRSLPGYRAPFELEDFWVVQRRATRPEDHGREMQTEAMVKVRVGDEVIQTAADGNGPVNALDAAVRKALISFYPTLALVKLVDYKVRIIDSAAGTGAGVRVLIESTDGDQLWRTVGASTDIIEASWLALNDALEYWLLKRAPERRERA